MIMPCPSDFRTFRVAGIVFALVCGSVLTPAPAHAQSDVQSTVDQFMNGGPAPASDQQPAAAQTTAPQPAAQTAPAAVGTSAANAPGARGGPRSSDEQDKAVKLARAGQYDEALATLSRLYQKDKNNASVARDYAAVLSWAGHDQDAVNVYETLPAPTAQQPQPDYLLAAMGHSYRKLNQTDKAAAVYRMGLEAYPANVTFAEGSIRCMVDQGQLDEALTAANEDLRAHGDRPEIVAVKNDIQQLLMKREHDKAVELARDHHYPEAIAMLQQLHSEHPDDASITADYLAVLDWSGGHDAEVIELYKSLPPGNQPDYVLEAVGHAYRNQHQYREASEIYSLGAQQYPDSTTFTIGQIRILSDSGRYEEALARANEDIRVHGPRPEVVAVQKDLEHAGPGPL